MSSDPKGTDNLQAEIAREYKEFKSSGEVMRLDDEPDELTTLRAQLQELEAELEGLAEDVRLPDIEAITRCRIRVRRINRLTPPEDKSDE